MTKKEFASMADSECASADNVIGRGRPAWDQYAIQFMYVPRFRFPHIPCYAKYRYTAVDENGKTHAFESGTSSADLSPIWQGLPEGVVKMTVCGVNADGSDGENVGTRTFFRLSPFPDDLPEKKRPYSEAASMAFEYAMSQSYIRHWLTDGTPDPDYDLNVYPSKMISSIIDAMIYYAGVRPEKTGDAVTIAKNAADYLIGITAREGVMKDVPPTFQTDFRDDAENRNNYTASERINRVMMLYPAQAGHSYVGLFKFTGDRKYLDEAIKIGEHYASNVLDNGSWHLIKDIHTGDVLSPNFCDPLEHIVPFLMSLYAETGDQKWRSLADGAIRYVENNNLRTYEWEGQFEDSVCSVNYSNLTHYGASALARHYAKYYADDGEKRAVAEDLMRFVEDQFVVWRRPAPWNKDSDDTTVFHTPCGLEQYNWYVPIDASTANILSAFLAMYKAGYGELYLEKAKALADSLTRVQYDDGLIPTHWMTREKTDLPFWINCMFHAAIKLAEIAEITEK